MRKYEVRNSALFFYYVCLEPFTFDQRAVEDLVSLRNSTPEESNVVFQLAKVYRLLGDEVNSAKTLALARDISPKSMNKIKKLLDTVKDEGDEPMDEG